MMDSNCKSIRPLNLDLSGLSNKGIQNPYLCYKEYNVEKCIFILGLQIGKLPLLPLEFGSLVYTF